MVYSLAKRRVWSLQTANTALLKEEWLIQTTRWSLQSVWRKSPIISDNRVWFTACKGKVWLFQTTRCGSQPGWRKSATAGPCWWKRCGRASWSRRQPRTSQPSCRPYRTCCWWMPSYEGEEHTSQEGCQPFLNGHIVFLPFKKKKKTILVNQNFMIRDCWTLYAAGCVRCRWQTNSGSLAHLMPGQAKRPVLPGSHDAVMPAGAASSVCQGNTTSKKKKSLSFSPSYWWPLM